MSNILTLTQALRESEILNLKPSSSLRFKNFDYVSYTVEGKKYYTQIIYDENVCAFVLVHYTDSNFITPIMDEEGYHKTSFIFEVGIENLKLV